VIAATVKSFDVQKSQLRQFVLDVLKLELPVSSVRQRDLSATLTTLVLTGVYLTWTKKLLIRKASAWIT